MRFGVSEHQDPRDRSRPRTLIRTRNVCRLRMSKKIAVTTPMSKRINVVLPDETVETLDRVAAPGRRSRFIADAVAYYGKSRGTAHLKERLKESYLADA